VRGHTNSMRSPTDIAAYGFGSLSPSRPIHSVGVEVSETPSFEPAESFMTDSLPAWKLAMVWSEQKHAALQTMAPRERLPPARVTGANRGLVLSLPLPGETASQRATPRHFYEIAEKTCGTQKRE